MIDQTARTFTHDQVSVLRDLAVLAEVELQRGLLSETQLDLIRERDELKRKASIDGLTRLWNRAAILELLRAELPRAKRGVPTCVAMIDSDHFKNVNDLHGHQAGDAVLIELATRIRRAVREFDAVGRFGGEEFIAGLSNCDLKAAQTVCERIRGFVADEPFGTGVGPIACTVSIGLAPCDPEHQVVERIVGAADAALYRAKNNGRNCIAI